MIVKDESHIILRTLNNLTKYINFDYWVISDTGSSDNTKELIKNFFKDKNIPGELTEVPWKDFGYNRSVVLQQAYNKSDYVFMFDADDQIMGNFILPKNLVKDLYTFQYGNSQGVILTRSQLFNNKKKWEYVGVLHEYVKAMEPVGESEFVKGDYYFTLGEEGNRSKQGEKYLKDAIILENAFYKTQNDKDTYLHSRYAYYTAQSYAGANNKEKSLEFYKKTLDLEGWLEEKYVSCMRIYDMLENKDDGIEYLIKASNYNSKRIECIYRLVVYYDLKNIHKTSFEYYKKIKDYYENNFYNNISDNTNKNILSMNNSEYKFYLPYSMIIVADRVKEYSTGIRMYEIIFKFKYYTISQFYAHHLISNLQFFYKHVTDEKFFIDMNIYIDLLRKNKLEINETLVETYKLIKQESTYLKINKNNIFFFVENDNSDINLNFWKNNYLNWEKETFEIFDKLLVKSKIFIDIGGWIGTTCIYAAKKSKWAYVVEADTTSFKYLSKNCELNTNNITLINKAIFNIDNKDISFGKNEYISNSTFNESMSQIQINKTITIDTIINTYNIDLNNISLIKVDIEGGEENIMNELNNLHKEHKIPIYLSFHYTWWKNKDLDRFIFLSNEQKDKIKKEPFTSILFI